MRRRITNYVVLAVVFLATTRIGHAEEEAATPGTLRSKSVLEATGIEGGLALVVESWDKAFCEELVAAGPFLVHVVLADGDEVAAARQQLADSGLYGRRITVGQWDGRRLPLLPRSVKLLVAAPPVDEAEVRRVLAPLGAAFIRGANGNRTIRAPWPDTIDQWTHFLHGPGNNAVARDEEVGPPRHFQWIGGPKYTRHHGTLASISAMVSARGRLFFIVDRGPIHTFQLAPQWQLEARDAFSGVNLWSREIESWAPHLSPFRHGPTELPRRLAAVGDHIFVTLGYGKPVSVLNAATGKTVRDLAGTDRALEIICQGSRLYVVRGRTETWDEAKRRGKELFPSSYDKSLVAVDWQTGKLIWEKTGDSVSLLMPTTLAVGQRRVFYQNTREIVCLDAETGQQAWKVGRLFGGYRRGGWGAPTLVVAGDVVLCAERKPGADAKQDKSRLEFISDSNRPCRGELIAYAVTDGRELWRCGVRENYNSPIDVLVANGLVWTGDVPIFSDPGFTHARDLRTGKVVRERRPDKNEIEVGMYHHRCYRVKGTEKYLLLSRAGTEFLDVDAGRIEAYHWVRGTCQYGLLPCNGLLYAPPHSCACYIEAKLTGFNALAPAKSRRHIAAEAAGEPLLKGPAYGAVQGGSPKSIEAAWPTYRADPSRSGRARCALPERLDEIWRVTVPGSKRLSGLVSAGGLLLGADVDGHAVFCIDAKTGAVKWRRTVGGPVDSPPTLVRVADKGELLCLFGCRDGQVYCLRASDGTLVWRYRLAPVERRMLCYQRMESVWPLHGSLLVVGDKVYCVAGRSSYLDGGLRFAALDAISGKPAHLKTIYSAEAGTGRVPRKAIHGFYMSGALPDVLSYDGTSIFMRHARLDMQGNRLKMSVPHLFSPAGFLDDNWWNRTYWIVGRQMGTGYKHWHTVAPLHVRGRIIVADGAGSFFGYRRSLTTQDNRRRKRPTIQIEFQTRYELFGASRQEGGQLQTAGSGPRETRIAQPFPYRDRWTRSIPVHARAMVLGGKLLGVAGRPDPNRRKDNDRTSRVMLVSTADGSTVVERVLPAEPVFDGMIAADGKLFASLANGDVVCIGRAFR